MSRLEQEKDAAKAAQMTAGPSKPLPSYMRPTSASQAMKKVHTASDAVECCASASRWIFWPCLAAALSNRASTCQSKHYPWQGAKQDLGSLLERRATCCPLQCTQLHTIVPCACWMRGRPGQAGQAILRLLKIQLQILILFSCDGVATDLGRLH